MDMSELVSAVVKEVLQHMENRKELPCVWVLAKRETALEERVRPLVEPYFPEGVDLVFFGEELGGRTPSKHILPHLCCSSMADLAAGRVSSRTLETVLSLLLKGISVEVLEFGYRDYADTAPGALYDLYVGYEKTLASYGLKEFKAKLPESVRVREKLITASMVEKYGMEGYRNMVVPADATITPLAAETADTLKVGIQKKL
ncbi:hypothetical protein [Mailhella sp.]